jgi:hypothetical protein
VSRRDLKALFSPASAAVVELALATDFRMADDTAGLAELPAVAASLTKQAIDAIAESPREAGLLIERLAYGLLAQTADAKERGAG